MAVREITLEPREKVLVPKQLGNPDGKSCYLPGEVKTPGFSSELVTGPYSAVMGVRFFKLLSEFC